MPKKFYIRKIVRDDGEQFSFDQEEIYLAEDNTLLVNAEVETTFEDYTEADGGEMIAQKLPSFEQEINGLIVPKTTDYWALRTKLTNFFQIRHTFYIVYEKISGETFTSGEKFKTGGAWIAVALQVPPKPYEDYSPWSVTFRIGSPRYQEYTEDPSGEETYANSVIVPLVSGASGGREWDSVGSVWDSVGAVWETGEGGVQEILVNSSSDIYPIWIVQGEAVNPSIVNNSLDLAAQYTGSVAEGQTLTVDFEKGTATLDGVVVTRNLSGQFSLKPGTNLVAFNADNASATPATLKWNNYL